MTADERLAAIEVTLQQLLNCTSQTSDRMDRVSERLEVVARLEERWKALDQRVGVLSSAFESELSRRTNLDEAIFERVRNIENQSGVNSYRRDFLDKLSVPVLSGLGGAGLSYILLQIFAGV